MTHSEAIGVSARRREISERLKALLVDRLELAMPPEWIADHQPLFGRGLELDSLDALELAVGLEYHLDLVITDEEVGVFGSIDAIVDFIEAKGIELPEGRPSGADASAWDADALNAW